MDRDTARRLAVICGVLVLAGHAVAAFAGAVVIFRLPMEAGGLVLAPMVGLPLLGAGGALVAAAVTLPLPAPPLQAVAALLCVLALDAFVLMVGLGSPLVLLGAVLAAASLGLLAVALLRA